MSTAHPSPMSNARQLPASGKHLLHPERRGTGFLRSLGLSLLVHALLIAALTWGVNWHQKTHSTPVQAELWSATVQQAAPLPTETPAPVPEPVPLPSAEPAKPAPPAPDPVKPTVQSPVPAVDPQIAIEKAKKRKALKEKQAQEQRLKEQEKAREQERLQAQLAEKKAKAAKEREKLEKIEKAERAEKAKADKEKLAKQEALQSAKEKKDLIKQDTAKAQAAADKARTDALKRMSQLAGQTGGSEGGRDRLSSAPSEGYKGRIIGRIKPNVTYTGDRNANIEALFEVLVAPDGRVTSVRLLSGSGVRAWDDAAQRAIEKTEYFPLDGGRAISPMLIAMRPRD